MPRYICKLDGMYFEWSTIVDAPITLGMTLEKFTEYYRNEYGEQGLVGLPGRMERVETKGTSSMIDDSVDELIRLNRAGEGESVASRDELVAMLKGGT